MTSASVELPERAGARQLVFDRGDCARSIGLEIATEHIGCQVDGATIRCPTTSLEPRGERADVGNGPVEISPSPAMVDVLSMGPLSSLAW